ncbi:protoporphyrinogen oxidase [Bradyrhizobium barranii subsp. barranii]
MLDLAIVGGGPGGLMSAWYLKRKLGDLCRITIYEASDRLGRQDRHA